jgi:hypothetical protein
MARAVIYSATTGRVRRIVLSDPSTSAQDLPPNLSRAGEAVLETDQPGDLNAMQALVTAETGLTPIDDRYALFDKDGNVIGAVIACPGCGDKVEHTGAVSWAKHPTAGIGWRHDGRDFVAPPEADIRSFDYDSLIQELEARKPGASDAEKTRLDEEIAAWSASRDRARA